MQMLSTLHESIAQPQSVTGATYMEHNTSKKYSYKDGARESKPYDTLTSTAKSPSHTEIPAKVPTRIHGILKEGDAKPSSHTHRGLEFADEGVSRDEKEKPSARRGVVSFEENSRVPTASGREVSFTDDSAEAKSTKSSMQGGSMLDLVTGVAESVSSLAEGISVVQGTSAAIGGANKQGSSSSEEPSNRTLG